MAPLRRKALPLMQFTTSGYAVARHIAAGLWLISATLLITATISMRDPHILLTWVIFTGMVAAVATCSLVVIVVGRRETTRVSEDLTDRLADAVACAVTEEILAQESAPLARIH